MKELVLKKCMKCGALVEVLEDCTCENCGIKCCGEQMQRVEPNNSDNVLQYEIIESELVVKIDREVEWVAMVSDNKIGKKFLIPNEKVAVTFPYEEGSTIYAYSKDGFWSKKVIK